MLRKQRARAKHTPHVPNQVRITSLTMLQETQRRPGGLTALAVLNFIFAGFSLMGLLFMAVAFVVLSTVNAAELDKAREDIAAAVGNAGLAAIAVNIALSLVALVLQVISAIGLLRMAPVMGRVMGNAFAVVSIVAVVVSVVMGIPFGVGTVINLLYPLLTLLLLNFTFRGDFIRRDAGQWGAAGGEAAASVASGINSAQFENALIHSGASDAAGGVAGAATDLAASAGARRALVASFGWRHALRGGSAVLYLLTLLGGGLMIAAAFINPVESLLHDSKPRAAERAAEMLRSGMAVDAIGWITGASEATCEYFVKEQPTLQSAILLMLLAFMPFFACMGGFNQTAGEIGSKGLRFLLLRTDRRSLFLGRFMAALVFSTIGLLVLTVVTTLYLAWKLDLYSTPALLWWGVQGTLALWLVMLPHLAATAWLSASLDSALAAFSLSMAVVSVPIALLKGIEIAVEKLSDHKIAWIERFMPWGWKYELLDPAWDTRLIASAMMLVFTVVFLAGGLRRFQGRDL